MCAGDREIHGHTVDRQGIVRGVEAGAAVERVVARAARERVVARAADQEVVAGAARQRVVAGVAEDYVVAGAAVDDVGLGGDVGRAGDNEVVAGGGRKHEQEAGAGDGLELELLDSCGRDELIADGDAVGGRVGALAVTDFEVVARAEGVEIGGKKHPGRLRRADVITDDVDRLDV